MEQTHDLCSEVFPPEIIGVQSSSVQHSILIATTLNSTSHRLLRNAECRTARRSSSWFAVLCLRATSLPSFFLLRNNRAKKVGDWEDSRRKSQEHERTRITRSRESYDRRERFYDSLQRMHKHKRLKERQHTGTCYTANKEERSGELHACLKVAKHLRRPLPRADSPTERPHLIIHMYKWPVQTKWLRTSTCRRIQTINSKGSEPFQKLQKVRHRAITNLPHAQCIAPTRAWHHESQKRLP